jgi:RNA polymerase sigma factor (sigma-70 family)
MKRVEAAEAEPRSTDREQAAVELMESSGAILRRTARRYSLCADDADDAYQRALEILLTKAPTTDPVQLVRWMHTVTKHEALAVRRNRERMLSSSPPSEGDHGTDPVDLLPALGVGPADHTLSREHVARSSEALHALKPQELRALILKAEGYSYAEICKLTGWTFTKVNRCMAEGRKRFLDVYASIEEGRRCDELAADLSAYSDGELAGEPADRIRRHLRSCTFCRAKAREYRRLPQRILALAPGALPASTSLWHRLTAWTGGAPVNAQAGEAAGLTSSALASGGTRGAGALAMAKILALCGATAAGGAACVLTGSVPIHLGHGDPAKSASRPGPAQPAQDPPPKAPASEPVPDPEPQAQPQPEAGNDAPPAPPPPPQEFAPTGAPIAGSSGTSGGGGGSAGGGGGAPKTGGSAEFGP